VPTSCLRSKPFERHTRFADDGCHTGEIDSACAWEMSKTEQVRATNRVQTVGTVVDGVAGATFGAALVSSGMVRHAKVSSPPTALSPAHGVRTSESMLSSGRGPAYHARDWPYELKHCTWWRVCQVAAFLDMLAPTRDFSLMFVMGGALAVATPAVQLLLAKRDEPKLIKLRSGKDLQVRSLN
jgi:hypothetical protein